MNYCIKTYIYDIWSTIFITFTDIECLGIYLAIGFNIGLILIGLALFTVMIGILSICFTKKEELL